MGEGLREIAYERAASRLVFFRQQAEIVAQRDQTAKQLLRFAPAASAGVRIDKPEAAGQESAFAAGQAILGLLGLIAQNKSLPQQVLFDGANGAEHSGVVGRQKPDRWYQEQARIQ